MSVNFQKLISTLMNSLIWQLILILSFTFICWNSTAWNLCVCIYIYKLIITLVTNCKLMIVRYPLLKCLLFLRERYRYKVQIFFLFFFFSTIIQSLLVVISLANRHSVNKWRWKNSTWSLVRTNFWIRSKCKRSWDPRHPKTIKRSLSPSPFLSFFLSIFIYCSISLFQGRMTSCWQRICLQSCKLRIFVFGFN